jgi:hypothetical protein
MNEENADKSDWTIIWSADTPATNPISASLRLNNAGFRYFPYSIRKIS